MTERQRVYFIFVLVLLSGSHGPWWWRVLTAQPDMRMVKEMANRTKS